MLVIGYKLSDMQDEQDLDIYIAWRQYLAIPYYMLEIA